MRYREYQSSDLPAILSMHRAQGFEYELPRMDDPKLWLSRMVILNESGRPCQSILGRLTSEWYYLDDPEAFSPAARMRRFLTLQEIAVSESKHAGMDTAHVWIPPQVQDKFGPQLERLGWQQFTWPTFVRQI
jgi:hypothetical protein